MSSVSSVGRSRIEQRRQAEFRRKRVVLVAVGLGVVVLVGAALALTRQGASPDVANGTFDYSAEDVARSHPVLAVHEMGAGPPIPYLPASGSQPAIAANESYVDVGSVGPTEVVERSFVIANTGEAPLTISRAYTTCGCTTAQISSAVIPPGQVAEVTLIFDAGFHDTRGQVVRRGLILENNDPKSSVSEIWIQASVRSN